MAWREKVALDCTFAKSCNVVIQFYEELSLFNLRNWSRSWASAHHSEAAHQSKATHPEDSYSFSIHDNTLWKNHTTQPEAQQK